MTAGAKFPEWNGVAIYIAKEYIAVWDALMESLLSGVQGEKSNKGFLPQEHFCWEKGHKG